MAGMADTELSFKDYVRVFVRRAPIFVGTATIVILIGVAIAFRMPPVYESMGVLLAEQPEVPEHVVRSTVPNYPEERVRIITQRVLTSANLAKVVEKNNVYPGVDESPAVGMALESISLSAEDPELLEDILGVNRAAGAIAFSLRFRHESPVIARDVTRDLVALYLEENQRARQEQAAETAQFLTREARRLELEIAEREQRLADFKEQHETNLPEFTNMNIQLLDRTERDLEDAEREIRMLREQRNLYSAELAELSPHAPVVNEEGAAILGPRDRLKMLQRTYAQLSAAYAQDHPDVLKVRREIEALSAATGLAAFDRETLQSELVARLDQLEVARNRYAADHPDVQRLERTVASLRQSIAEAPPRSADLGMPSAPDNPLYIQRQVQLQATETELEAALTRREQLRARLTNLEGRLSLAPEVEREYNALSRGYEQLLSQYGEVQNTLREAQTALNLETESRGERFTVLTAPRLPTSPAQPNRIAIVMLTIVVAFGLAAGVAAIAESSDTTIRNARDVALFLEIPPLVAIPNIENQQDVRRRSMRRLSAAAAMGIWAALIGYFVLTPAA